MQPFQSTPGALPFPQWLAFAASSFRYNFIAENAGTHFYHSHSGEYLAPIHLTICIRKRNWFPLGFQRADGVFGSLIVRQSRHKDPHSPLYDYDLPEHVILVSDWLPELGISKFVAHHHDDGDNKPSSMIINGRGRIPKPRNELNANQTMPLAVFSVQKVCKSH